MEETLQNTKLVQAGVQKGGATKNFLAQKRRELVSPRTQNTLPQTQNEPQKGGINLSSAQAPAAQKFAQKSSPRVAPMPQTTIPQTTQRNVSKDFTVKKLAGSNFPKAFLARGGTPLNEIRSAQDVLQERKPAPQIPMSAQKNAPVPELVPPVSPIPPKSTATPAALRTQMSAREDRARQTIPKDPLFAAHVLTNEKGKLEPQQQKERSTAMPTSLSAADAQKKSYVVRTYKSDVAKALKTQNTSMVQMVLAEHKKKEVEKEEVSAVSRKNLPLIITSTILISVGVALLGWGAWYMLRTGTVPLMPVKVSASSLIFVEEQQEINTTKKTRSVLTDEIAREIISTDIRLDFIKQLYFTKNETVFANGTETQNTRILTTKQFMDGIESSAPDRLLRSLSPDFLFGVHSFNGNQPFIIFKTSYFENVFAGMLTWEPRLANDLLPVFAYEGSDEIYRKSFEDAVVKNRDLRVLREQNGDIALLYMMLNKDTLIITTNIDTLDEVILRLNKKALER